ncbi:hypothetical protein [Rhodospirillum sp. A1_3_36]|uniref:hypothetical protein n=1 Tax=Rhodospirillum sp. A1_3_36 TaxID=3391666 RepID=UPI0039A69DC9
MFDAAGLAQLARKAMDRMGKEQSGSAESARGPIGSEGDSRRLGRDRGRALSVLRAIHPELSLRQAEALLVGQSLSLAEEVTLPSSGGQPVK